MIVLENSAQIVTVYVGHYASVELGSNFNAHAVLKIGYIHFMAWLYEDCTTIISSNGIVNFTITDSYLDDCINQCFDETGEKLEFKLFLK